MRKTQLGAVAVLALTLTACGGADEPENNIAAEEVNAMMNLEELPPAEPAANAVAETPAAEESRPEPTTSKPAAPAKPAPAKPKPAEPAPDPHAGHDMNDMQH